MIKLLLSWIADVCWCLQIGQWHILTHWLNVSSWNLWAFRGYIENNGCGCFDTCQTKAASVLFLFGHFWAVEQAENTIQLTYNVNNIMCASCDAHRDFCEIDSCCLLCLIPRLSVLICSFTDLQFRCFRISVIKICKYCDCFCWSILYTRHLFPVSPS